MHRKHVYHLAWVWNITSLSWLFNKISWSRQLDVRKSFAKVIKTVQNSLQFWFGITSKSREYQGLRSPNDITRLENRSIVIPEPRSDRNRHISNRKRTRISNICQWIYHKLQRFGKNYCVYEDICLPKLKKFIGKYITNVYLVFCLDLASPNYAKALQEAYNSLDIKYLPKDADSPNVAKFKTYLDFLGNSLLESVC